jgi:hypothetical protein
MYGTINPITEIGVYTEKKGKSSFIEEVSSVEQSFRRQCCLHGESVEASQPACSSEVPVYKQ